jgi:ABC-type transport system substrate-binding protein
VKRLLALLLVVAAATAAAGAAAACKSGHAPAPPPPGAPDAAPAPVTLRIHLGAEPPHLNPLLSSDFTITQVALGDVYEPLYRLAGDGATVEPILAERVDVSADEREWTFTLREGARWHDGRPLSAADVVYTLRLLAPGGAPAVIAADFDDVEAVTAVDARTVRVRFRGFRLGRRESFALVPVLPEHVFAATPAAELFAAPATRAPVGTGPYAFDAWEPGRELRLRRATTWRGPRPPADTVVYRVIGDRAQALAQLRAGELDLLLAVAPGPLLDEAAADARLRLVPYDFPYYLAARWSCRKGPLADARVRRALTMSLDRDAVVGKLLAGRGRVASAPWEPDDAAYDAAVTPWPFDPEGARRLLAEAGHPRGVTVRLLVPRGSATLERIATVWREDAARAGITLEIVPDPAVIDRARSGAFEGAAYGWTTGPEQDLYHHFHSSQIGADNYGGCADAEVDRLLEAIRATPDAAARRALEHRLHARLHELEWVTVISVDVRTAVVGPRLAGVRPGTHGAPVRDMTVAPGSPNR